MLYSSLRLASDKSFSNCEFWRADYFFLELQKSAHLLRIVVSTTNFTGGFSAYHWISKLVGQEKLPVQEDEVRSSLSGIE